MWASLGPRLDAVKGDAKVQSFLKKLNSTSLAAETTQIAAVLVLLHKIDLATETTSDERVFMDVFATMFTEMAPALEDAVTMP
ncbi:hypothetical protein SDRG_17290 [Saprolegnia diclina VS20]|uniref:Uncharacterized protein n=1 Tax=Saprolegnia diclina (strain VS20) TaxID=1156394 RepID=T0PUY3_SAPDV|nr:hypothetical protein SDRG_17290 [Saprolegnia diclina VS20]EQC24820.1 hypothetical protein SDRG_17290 [Saprolegnia diclina VS20]|eukprot:XP_008621751.1 hypothetical protein SDRG_17290 [Saprolegnia diclina VS20]